MMADAGSSRQFSSSCILGLSLPFLNVTGSPAGLPGTTVDPNSPTLPWPLRFALLWGFRFLGPFRASVDFEQAWGQAPGNISHSTTSDAHGAIDGGVLSLQ